MSDPKPIPSVSVAYAQTGASTSSNELGMRAMQERACEKRIAGAQLQPTFPMASVKVVDRFGRPVVPCEWFQIPLFAIKKAVERIRDGTIAGYVHDPQKAQL